MPTSAKPLFRPEALRPRLTTFTPPLAASGARGKLANWAKLLGSPQAQRLKETELLTDFITDVFGSVLGYTGPAAGSVRYTIKREATVEVDGNSLTPSWGVFRQRLANRKPSPPWKARGRQRRLPNLMGIANLCC